MLNYFQATKSYRFQRCIFSNYFRITFDIDNKIQYSQFKRMVKELEVFIGTMYFKLLRLLLQTRSRNVFIDTQIMRNKRCKKLIQKHRNVKRSINIILNKMDILISSFQSLPESYGPDRTLLWIHQYGLYNVFAPDYL